MLKRIFLLLFLIGCSQEATTTISTQAGFGFDIQSQDISKKNTDTDSIDTVSVDAEDTKLEDTDSTQVEDVDEVIEEVQEDTEQTPLECIDEDGDGYGENCEYGQDCDDTNPNFSVECPDCSKGNIVGCACTKKTRSEEHTSELQSH